MAREHQTESGKVATNRGKPPHKHGYHARMKPVNPFKIWWTVGGKGTKDDPGQRVACPWSPGRTHKQK